jgi:hypothetical protein
MAARFWVTGGTGNWSSTTNWSATTGGASGASVPGSADTATFDASSGAGTATVDSSVTIQTLTMTGFTGTLAFGTNTISVNSTGTVYTGDTTFSVTGTPVINVTSTGSTAITVTPGVATEANSISFNFTGGTYTLTFLNTASNSARNINFTGFAGTWNLVAAARTIYGSLTLSTGMTFGSATGVFTFGGTSGTQLITCNGKSFLAPIAINGVGGTMKLVDALTMGSASIFSHTNGTLDLNGQTLTVGTRYTTVSGTKNLTFNGGTLVCPSANTTSFNNQNPTNYTITAGTGTGKISMTAATAKSFVGGGATFPCTLSNDGAGALTITGSNTFTTLANGVSPTTFSFTAGTTTTVTNWNVSGTAGNLVTIGSVTAASHTLSKASGTVSADYLSISYSTATGGAAWFAGANSTNGGNNSGWVFSNATTGNFFFFFLV